MSVIPLFTEEELERLWAYGIASPEEKPEMLAVYEHCYLNVEDDALRTRIRMLLEVMKRRES